MWDQILWKILLANYKQQTFNSNLHIYVVYNHKYINKFLSIIVVIFQEIHKQ
ncbi:hypothetical protein CCP3SC1AL1_3910002 [Gammaproteobacteria bacterium]